MALDLVEPKRVTLVARRGVVMTSAVERLAAAPCPAKTVDPYHDEACCFCVGTGAKVPGLRRECPGDESEEHLIERRGQHIMGKCCCHGRGWSLWEPEKQMGVLARAARHFSLFENTDGTWTAHIITDKLVSVTCLEDTPEEALGQAICQSLGIE